jgi:hypothetical protein
LRFTLLLAAAWLALALPVQAAETGPQAHVKKDPRMAAGLAWGITAAAFYSESFLELPPLRFGQLATIATLAPMGFGAGHLYAGDYTRGALVSLAGPFVVTGTAMAFQAVHDAQNPVTDLGSMDQTPYFRGWLLAVLAYGTWASWDAYQTAERANREAHIPRGPTPLTVQP